MTLNTPESHHRLLYWLDRLSDTAHADLAARLSEFEVTAPQWPILNMVERGETRTIRGIAARLGMDGGAVTRLAQRLEAKGLLRRETEASDKRSVTLHLTDLSRDLMPQIHRAVLASERAFFGTLNFSELRQFKAVIAKLLPPGAGPDAVWLRSDLGQI